MNKVWTFVIGKQLSQTELDQLTLAGRTFVDHWTAHEHQLEGSFDIYGGRIVVVRVNENTAQASGCSIDKLTRFMKVSESKFGVELLNRMKVAYRSGDGVEVADANDIRSLLENRAMGADTIVFDTAVSSDAELAAWEKPLKDTWLSKYLSR